MGVAYYTSIPYRYRLTETKRDYFFHLTQNWYNLYAKYRETEETLGTLELPSRARASRKKLHAKLQRYRQRVRKF